MLCFACSLPQPEAISSTWQASGPKEAVDTLRGSVEPSSDRTCRLSPNAGGGASPADVWVGSGCTGCDCGCGSGESDMVKLPASI